MEISKNLKLAMQVRNEEELTIAVVKNNQILFTSKNSGILPLYNAYKSGIDFAGSCVADKVIGKGAAMILLHLKINELHTFVISKSAYNNLQDNDVVVSYDDKVEFISNRKGDGKCPVETLAENHVQFEDFIVGVEQFLKRAGLI